MKQAQYRYTTSSKWEYVSGDTTLKDSEVSLVMYFGSASRIGTNAFYSDLSNKFPDAALIGCSAGGQILNDHLLHDSVILSAIKLSTTQIRSYSTTQIHYDDLAVKGRDLGQQLNAENLAGVFLLCDGLSINGSALLRGLTEGIDGKAPIFGGLATDEVANFKTTLVGLNNRAKQNTIAAIGFYGNDISFQFGSLDGCRVFGPIRRVTKSSDNVVYELDDKPILDLFESYLGEDAQDLPGSALQFPLRIRREEGSTLGVNRTVLSIDREQGSMTFAGDVPQGSLVQLMRASLERLIEGAETAALQALEGAVTHNQSLALLISCIGRKVAYGERIATEIDAIAEIFDDKIPSIGFYSNGEIAPYLPAKSSELLNHTMTIVLMSESE